MKIIALLVVLLICSVGLSSATDYYVATTGNNASNGLTTDTAWLNVAYGVNQLVAGDTLYLIHGTWESEIIDFDGKQGNATHPITLTKYNGTVILNNSYIEASATDTLDMYINISDITISNSIGNGIYFRYSDNIHIENVEVFNTGAGGKAIYFLDAWNSSLIDSNLHDTGWNTVMVQSNYNDVYNILIDNNTIYNSSHAGSQHNTLDFYNYNTGGSMHDVIVRNNHIHNAAEQLLFFHNDGLGVIFHNFTIHNNVFHDSGISGYVGVNYLTNSVVSNNTIYNSGLRNDGGTARENVTYRNNTIYNPLAQQYTIQLSGTPTQTHYSINDNSSLFRSLTGNLVVTDAFLTSYSVRGSGVGTTVEYTDNSIFYESGSNSPTHYSTHSNWTTNEDTNRLIKKYNMTVKPSANYVSVINTTSIITIDSYAQIIPRIDITIGLDVSNKNITLSNATTTHNYSLYYLNGTFIESEISSSPITFNSITSGNYYVLEDTGFVPVTNTLYVGFLYNVVNGNYSTSGTPTIESQKSNLKVVI